MSSLNRYEVRAIGTKVEFIAYANSETGACLLVQEFIVKERKELVGFKLKACLYPMEDETPIRYQTADRPGGHEYKGPKT